MRVGYFAAAEAVGELEDLLREDPGHREARLALAWYLRQADTRRALQLADEAERDARHAAGTDAGHILGRVALVRADAAIQHAQLDEAQAHLDAARTHFAGDALGSGDVALGAVFLANARGRAADALALAREAAERFAEAPALEAQGRCDVAAAYAALTGLYADPAAAPSRLEALEARAATLPPEAQVLVEVTRALEHFNRGSHIEVVKALEPAAQATLRLGMLQLRLRIGNTIAAAYSNLDDKDAAIAWVEESLDLARAAGWPVATGEALAFLGNFYREVGQVERARQTLVQAREALAIAPRSRGYALACCYLAHAELAAGSAHEALALAKEAEVVATAINALPIAVDVLTVAARARSRLGEPAVGAAIAMRALELAESGALAVWRVDVLRALAEIHAAHRLEPPEGVAPGRAPLHFLVRAQAVVRELSGHAESVAIARELARAHEAAGDLREALDAERGAMAQALSDDARRIGNRLLAVEARHEVEKQRIEVTHQRRVAAAEAARAGALAASLEVLQRLSMIGQEITAKLDAGAALGTLVRHVGALVESDYVGLALHEPQACVLLCRAYEAGAAVPDSTIAVDDARSPLARCFREGGELLTPRAWFGRLEVEGASLGVLAIRSAGPGAFGEREQLILRTLASYTAVALANARAYQALDRSNEELRAAQGELERLANTDSLTGIANRRRFLAAARAECDRARRYRRPVALVMADIDRFKSINDTRGHPCGDRVIATAARVLDAERRSIDSAGRLGGEEFALLLPEADAATACSVAQRLRGAIEAATVEWEGEAVRVTMSFGVAVLAADDGPLAAEAAFEDLVQRADAALYAAKAAGRNCVREAPSTGAEAAAGARDLTGHVA